jgi:glycosyltransferase involved in cell wall biosynthesis
MITARRLRILYDASLADNPAGTGTFVRGLLGALETRSDVELITTSFESRAVASLDALRKTPLARLASGIRHLAYYLRDLSRQARAKDCDVICCPTSLVPLGTKTPYLMTVFDLTPLHHAGTQERLSHQYIRTMMRLGIRRAAGIATISRAVADEILQTFPRRPASGVSVSYPGPNQQLIDAAPVAARITEQPFVLMVGTLEPRKNHLTVLRAMAEHRRRHPNSSLRLVLAGSPGWHYAPILRAIDDLSLAGQVIRLGSTPSGVLKWLFQHATALLFPSLYEGFGLPVLEALYLQCPVIAAAIPSVAEIVGTSAPLLPPTDVAAWAEKLDQVAADPRGIRTGIQQGLERARRFTWEACAESTVAALQAAASPK